MPKPECGLILGLDHTTQVVADLPAAVARYTTLFNQPPAAEGSTAALAWAQFALANTALVLVQPQGTADALAQHLAATTAPALGAAAFSVAEPEHVARLLERRGLPSLGPALPWLDRPATLLAPEAARGLALLLLPPAAAGHASATRLDHLVIRSANPERSIALLAGRLGLELRLDRSNPAWGNRLLFFRCGDLVVEVSHALAEGISDAPDSLWGLTWGVADVAAQHARLAATGLAVSPLRQGRKPGTRLFTLREHAHFPPTAFIGS